MLDELLNITSTEPYKSSGGMSILDVSITPRNSQARFVFEIWMDEYGFGDIATQRWEITCMELAQTDGIPQVITPGTQLKLYNEHPVLWHWDDEVYFTITSKANNISALMGALFIEHTKLCGN